MNLYKKACRREQVNKEQGMENFESLHTEKQIVNILLIPKLNWPKPGKLTPYSYFCGTGTIEWVKTKGKKLEILMKIPLHNCLKKGFLRMEKSFNLDILLIDFATEVVIISESLPNTIAGRHIGGQIARSGTAPALHYGEAQSAESRNDFIHKMKVALKELKETFNCLRIIQKMSWYSHEKMVLVLDENNQLISIFVKSIATAQLNKNKQKNETKK